MHEIDVRLYIVMMVPAPGPGQSRKTGGRVKCLSCPIIDSGDLEPAASSIDLLRTRKLISHLKAYSSSFPSRPAYAFIYLRLIENLHIATIVARTPKVNNRT
jgi:hypothetical protein